ncbi:FadR/GntR family transcriptional regulator [Roseomonas populi]|uniref:FCD domain-containing protein n=1 Tax=Roseomonas populi TaxID=3121582 RepID=A0ABT1XAT0_9PROT|nr:FCD domain-containing protein [Roseomonas pecuniae]MCR0985210.1 FCD domain-containing protein [Roseomonas pecuniae]
MPADLAADRLEAHLREVGLQPGDRLLPERQLTARLGISRRALREVLGELELQGRIWRGVGQGTFLGPKPAGPRRAVPAAQASHPLAIMEARMTLEPAMASLAAIKATATDVAAIARAASRGAETSDQESWGRWDGAFHGAIARACHNPLLLTAFETIEDSRARTDWGRLRAAITTKPLRQASALEHQAISAAIATRDAAAAQRAMRAHLQSVHLAIQVEEAGWNDDTPDPRNQHADGHAHTARPAERAPPRRTSRP